jgi:hypothetical protein
MEQGGALFGCSDGGAEGESLLLLGSHGRQQQGAGHP